MRYKSSVGISIGVLCHFHVLPLPRRSECTLAALWLLKYNDLLVFSSSVPVAISEMDGGDKIAV